jgi:transcription elongation factor Elf1
VESAQRQSGMRRRLPRPSPNRRKREMERRIDEVRTWFLTCPECEHLGEVDLTLRQLRSRNLICSECGWISVGVKGRSRCN